MNNIDDKFYEDIDFLKKAYKNKPFTVYKHVETAVKKVKDSDKPLIEKKDLEIFFTIIISILMCLFSLIGLFNPLNEGGDIVILGIFGFVFFIAGYFINFQAKGAGIIFLFSHGMTGFCIMCGPIVAQILKLPFMQDNPINIYIYLGVLALIAFVSLLSSVVISLSDKLLSIKYIKIFPLMGFAFAYLWLQILPFIVDKIYLLNFFS